jgi:hypothetical protein
MKAISLRILAGLAILAMVCMIVVGTLTLFSPRLGFIGSAILDTVIPEPADLPEGVRGGGPYEVQDPPYPVGYIMFEGRQYYPCRYLIVDYSAIGQRIGRVGQGCYIHSIEGKNSDEWMVLTFSGIMNPEPEIYKTAEAEDITIPTFGADKIVLTGDYANDSVEIDEQSLVATVKSFLPTDMKELTVAADNVRYCHIVDVRSSEHEGISYRLFYTALHSGEYYLSIDPTWIPDDSTTTGVIATSNFLDDYFKTWGY